MKIAILHDYFDEIGGAEIALLYLARGMGATIFTTNIDRKKIDELGFSDVKIKSIGRVPNIKNIKQISTIIRFRLLKIKGYDLYVLGGFYSIYVAAQSKPNIWICFSPLRGLYDLRYDRFSQRNFIIQGIKELQIKIDKGAVKNLEKILAPSLNVFNRIKKYYNRESIVIYHPVDTKKFIFENPQDYWLSVSRIDYYKRIDLQIDAFKKIKDEKLIIVGEPARELENYFYSLKNGASPNILFKGAIYKSKELVELYANCKGFITTSKDEDFGLNVIEAMASGKPVIAPNEGGYKETIINGKTGVLIDDIDDNKLAEAVKKLGKKIDDNPLYFKDACQQQARKFDTEVFISQINKEIQTILNHPK